MTHNLYTAKDFTDAEYESGNQVARLVIDGGIQACKSCGAREAELDEFPTCADYNAHRGKQRAASAAARLEGRR